LAWEEVEGHTGRNNAVEQERAKRQARRGDVKGLRCAPVGRGGDRDVERELLRGEGRSGAAGRYRPQVVQAGGRRRRRRTKTLHEGK